MVGIIEKRFTVATVIDDHGAAIGIEEYTPLDGSRKEITYIASIFIDEELSGNELFRRAIDEVVRIAGNGVDVIQVKSSDPRAIYVTKRMTRKYSNVNLRYADSGMVSTVELGYDALRRAAEGRPHLTIEENLKN